MNWRAVLQKHDQSGSSVEINAEVWKFVNFPVAMAVFGFLMARMGHAP